MHEARYHAGKPAVYDSESKTYTYGFATLREARSEAIRLNSKQPIPSRIARKF